MIRQIFVGIVFLVLGAMTSMSAAEEDRNHVFSGRFTLLTYNVAGLPQGISQSQPLFFMRKISPRLNAFDLVLAQEDFAYPAQLRAATNHPFYDGRSQAGILGDGLSRFSRFPFGPVEHVAWVACYGTFGHANDCLTPKGFSFAVHELAPGVRLHVYNLHMDAGGSLGDFAARDAQMEQLIAYVGEHSAGQALIIAGDFNLSGDDPPDLECLQKLLSAHQVTDVGLELAAHDRIDRILYRSSHSLILTPLAYQVERRRFSTRLGWPLSDHQPVSAVFRWEYRPPGEGEEKASQ